MAVGRPTKPLNVTPKEKQKLAMLARRPKSAQAFAMRARIVLACAEGLSNGAAAKKLHLTGATVCKWRERFRVSRLEGLLDEPRPGCSAIDYRRAGRGGGHPNAGVHARQQHALEHSADGREDWAFADCHRADLACFRIAAAPSGELQVLQRPAVRRKGAGHRRVVPESAGSRNCAVCRRKKSGPGAEPYAADSAAGPRRTGATIP